MKVIIGIIITLVILVALSATFKQHGKGHTKIVMVSVHTFNGGDDNYMCYDYKIDSVTKCLTFEDNFGIGRTICNNYTISTIGK
jgi:hypothetical protein